MEGLELLCIDFRSLNLRALDLRAIGLRALDLRALDLRSSVSNWDANVSVKYATSKREVCDLCGEVRDPARP